MDEIRLVRVVKEMNPELGKITRILGNRTDNTIHGERFPKDSIISRREESWQQIGLPTNLVEIGP